MSDYNRNEKIMLDRVRRMALSGHGDLLNASHEAHHLYEEGVISKEAYDEIYRIVMDHFSNRSNRLSHTD
jgi:hypothetical protein